MNKDFYINIKDDREAGGSSSFFKEKVKFLISESQSNNKILDVGCNDGYIGELLLKNHNDMYGLDIVEKKLQLAKKKGLKVKLCDIEHQELPFPKNYFDIVILGDMIEHVFDTDRLLIKCKKVLKSGGKLLISTPNVSSLGRRIMLLLGKNPFLEYSTYLLSSGLPPVGHVRYYTKQDLSYQLKKHGFQRISIQGDEINLIFFQTRLFRSLLPTFCKALLATAYKK